MLGLERDRISLHRSEGFSHLGAPGGLEGLPGDPIGLHETFGTLLKALGVAFRCYPGSKLRLCSAPPPPRSFWQGKHIYLIRCVLVLNVHVNVTSSQLCWCSKDQINILPWAQCAFPEEMAGRGLDWGLRTSHPLSVMVSFPPAPLAGSPPWGRAVRSISLARSLARSLIRPLARSLTATPIGMPGGVFSSPC